MVQINLLLVLSLLSSMKCKSQKFSIINGIRVNIRDYPYQCSLRTHGNPVCGASVISKNHAITAAHCTNIFPSQLSLRCGSSFVHSGGIIIDITSFVQHPFFDSTSFDFDFSILRFRSSIKLDTNIQVIQLPTSNIFSRSGVVCSISGFGMNQHREYSNDLLAANVSIIDHQLCASNYKNSDLNFTITNRMLCAGALNTSKATSKNVDACFGDSGGPLVAKVSGSSKVLVGVISAGFGCGDAKFYGIYSNVWFARNWIKFVTDEI